MRGVTTMLADFPDRLVVISLPAVRSKAPGVDVIVYDAIGLHLGDGADLEHLVHETDAKILVLNRETRPDLRAHAHALGATSWVSMDVHAGDLVRSIELTALGEPVGEPEPEVGPVAGLTTRELEVLALITQGLSNKEIAAKLLLSVNTLKSHIRQAYRKIGVSSRSQAVSWAITHGLAPSDQESSESGASVGAQMVTAGTSAERSG
ncbi:LuxR family two component transcriptional regulator [Nocardioides albertanoniae]|uniref:LuxR family two component transcriptional regulator n=1 Tax=Nocardioides albertanoniae TaxID=1175486 RepID=A0A543A938_9ACTN|nr:response regulator transcription factor [Nocardioides albertanoniae]TQL69124.1 LuxR family two component transcriptional regulator [Nocardioides albertanoniae]